MKIKYLLLLTVLTFVGIVSFGQSVNCVTATSITLDASGAGCATGSTVGGDITYTTHPCYDVNTPITEVFYTFVIDGPVNEITISPNGGNPATFIGATLSDNCTAGSLTCQLSPTANGSITLNNGLTPGNSVIVSVAAMGNPGGFEICVSSTQAPPTGGNTCATPIQLCDVNTPYDIDMSAITPSGAQPDCFGGPVNDDVWFTFTVTQTGTLQFQGSPVGTSTGDLELDWALFDITGGCPTDLSGSGGDASLDCNYNWDNLADNPSGMNAAGGGEFNPEITVNAGNTYAILMDVYSNTVGSVDLLFEFLPGMTAEIAPNAEFTVTPTTTCGASVDVSITDNSYGATPEWTFGDGASSTGSNPADHTYTAAGTYAITSIVDDGVCVDIHTEFIQLLDPVLPIISGNDETCAGDCDGDATVVTTGGSGVYTYSWTPGGETTNSITGLCSGNYSVTVTDATCGNANDNTTISGPTCAACSMVSATGAMTDCYVDGGGFLVYEMGGSVTFTDPPATGTLVIENCYGQRETFNAPFTSPQAYSFVGNPQSGDPCDLVAFFTDSPAGTDDGSCSINIPFTEPTGFTLFSFGNGFCQPDNSYSSNGTISFTTPPTTGTLVIEINDGINTYDTIINPPFVSGQDWSISGMTSNGNATTLTAYFTDIVMCAFSTTSTAPAACGCVADVGSFTTTITGDGSTNFVLCFNDQIDITSDGNWTPAEEALNPPITASDPGASYDPDLAYFVYSCPPTIFPPDDLFDGAGAPLDPCFVGYVANGTFFSDINTFGEPSFVGPWVNNTVYYVPITFYDITSGYYSYVNTAESCYDLGDPISVQYLPEVTETNTSDCAAGSVTATINGGLPEVDGSNFTATNLLPATASFVNTTAADGGDIVINGLADGDMWSFDVTDNNGCPITITGGPFVGGPSANGGADDDICALTYTLSAIPSIGTGAWTGPAGISFSNPASPTSNATATAAGTYTLTWTETSGVCSGFATVDITFSDPSFTYVANPAQCGVADGDITINATGGIAPYTFSIDNGTTTQLGNTFGTLITNNYNGYIIDDVGCVFTNVIPVANSGSPFIDAVNVTHPTCGGSCDGEVEIVVSGGTPPYSYSLDGVALILGQDTWTGVCGNLADLSILVEDDIGCQNTGVATVTNPTPVIHSSTPTQIDCTGDTDGEIIVIASGGDGNLTYTLDDGVNPPVIQANGNFLNLPSGTYTITVTDGLGCSSASVAETIDAPDELLFDFVTPFPTTCNGVCDGNIVTQVSGGTGLGTYNYNWSANASTGNLANAQNLCAGSYSIIVTDGNGCQTDSINIEIVEPPVIVFTSQTPTDVSCFGVCDGQIFVEATDATTYSIDLPGSATVTAPNATFTGLCAGNYEITAAQTGGNCPITTTITVGTPDQILLTSTIDTTICIGGTAQLFAEASGGDGNYNFTWNTTETTQSISISGLVSSSLYDVSVVDGNGCSGGTSFSIVNLNNPIFVTALSDQSICPGASADLSAFVASNENGNGNLTYTWFEGATQIGTGIGINVSPTVTTTYTITVNDDCETPPHSADVTITVNTNPIVDFLPNNTEGCVPVVVDFSNVGVPAGSQYFWDFGDGNASQDENPTNSYTDPGCYDVSLNIIDANGCSNSVTYPSLVCGYPYPTADFTFGPQPTTVLNPEIQFSNQSTGAIQYEWLFGTNGSLGSSSEINPTLVFPSDQPGTYPVCLAVENASGCRDSICYDVIIDDEFLVYVPNAFTPDGDGDNDIFMPVVTGVNPLNYKFLVFNRWGELIFESQIPEVGWDGTYKGQISKTDVYVWKLEVSSITNGEKKSFNGHVSLLK